MREMREIQLSPAIEAEIDRFAAIAVEIAISTLARFKQDVADSKMMKGWIS